MDSLAAGYARTIRDAERLADRSVDVVHVVGGGSQNRLLCQLTADATGRKVVAGPVEATALGNVLVQARAAGSVDGGLGELRAMVVASSPLQVFVPEFSRL
jgi:rhamnulokinase